MRTPQGPADTFVMKFNADWSYAWTVTFGGPSSISTPLGLSVSSTAIVVTGLYQVAIDLDPGPGTLIKTTFSPGGYATYVVSLGLDGHLKWGGALETGSECQAQALTLDANEDVYLAGFYEGTCDLDPGPASDVWAASINALHGFLIKLRGTDGTRLWATSTLELNPPTVPRAATVAPDGNVWLAGEYDGTQMTTATIASYTPAGVLRFMHAFDGSGASSGSNGLAVGAAADGSIYVGGTGVGMIDFDPGPGTALRQLVADTDEFGNSVGSATFVLKLAADGTFRWVQTIANVSLRAFALRPGGGVIVAGAIPVPGGMGGISSVLLTRVDSDSTPAWSISFGGPDSGLTDLTAGASTIDAVGITANPVDLEPGPAVDMTPAGAASFLMHFAD
jgi:hypothetical protein